MWALFWGFLVTLSREWKLAITALLIIFLISMVPVIKRFLTSVRDGLRELFTKSGIVIFTVLAIITLIFLASFGVI